MKTTNNIIENNQKAIDFLVSAIEQGNDSPFVRARLSRLAGQIMDATGDKWWFLCPLPEPTLADDDDEDDHSN